MERTYVFNQDGNGSGGSKLDITAMLPGIMGGGRSLDPNLLAVMGNNGGFGGQNGIWGVIYLAIVASIFGWNNNGNGFFGGRGNAANGTPELVTSLLNRNETAIGQLAQSLNCSTQQIQSALCNIENSVGLTGTQIINAIQSGNNSVITQMNTNTRDLRDATQAQTQAILAKLDAAETRVLQDKLDAERQKSATLAAQLNNEHQTQAIMANVAQQNAPIVAALQALQSDVDGIKCKLPQTISVPYPTVTAVNTDLYRAAAYGAAAGNYAGYGCGCGYNAGFWN